VVPDWCAGARVHAGEDAEAPVAPQCLRSTSRQTVAGKADPTQLRTPDLAGPGK